MSNKLILLILMTYTGFFTSLASFAEDNEAQNKLKIIKKNIVSENQKKLININDKKSSGWGRNTISNKMKSIEK